MGSPYGSPVQGYGAPNAPVIQSGNEYYDLNGFNLWRPTNIPGYYKMVSGIPAAKNFVSYLQNGSVTTTQNGLIIFVNNESSSNGITDNATGQLLTDPATTNLLVPA